MCSIHNQALQTSGKHSPNSLEVFITVRGELNLKWDDQQADMGVMVKGLKTT